MRIELLLLASFGAGSVLITFGGVLGKTSPFQMLTITVVELILYAVNENICYFLGVADIGGSMVIHCFGAFFGIAVTKVLHPKGVHQLAKAEPNYMSDITSFIGTIFLFMYWPSFNGALALSGSPRQTRAFINTVLSISGSCVAAFIVSVLFRTK
jgi:ammonium transporter Rh